MTWTSVPSGQLKIIEGDSLLKKYESSPKIYWMSCDHCNSSLFQTTHTSPDRTYVNVASLTDPLDRVPDSHVSIEEKVRWITINDGLPQFKAKASERLN